MATLDNYKGSLKVSAGLTPMGDFPVAEAHDILVDAQGTRLDTKLTELANGIGTGGGSGSSSGSDSGSTGESVDKTYVEDRLKTKVDKIGNSVTSHKVYLAAASDTMGVTKVALTSRNLRYAPGNNTDATVDGEVPLRRASDQTMQCETPANASGYCVANVRYVNDKVNGRVDELASVVVNDYLTKEDGFSKKHVYKFSYVLPGIKITLSNGIYFIHVEAERSNDKKTINFTLTLSVSSDCDVCCSSEVTMSWKSLGQTQGTRFFAEYDTAEKTITFYKQIIGETYVVDLSTDKATDLQYTYSDIVVRIMRISDINFNAL